MRAIFLNKDQKMSQRIYKDFVIDRLHSLVELDDTVYGKEDILADSERFADTEFIFSTWGMPVFTEDEIKECFPSLKCVFYAAGSVQSFARPFINCGVKVFSAWAANAVPVAECSVAEIILANKGVFAQMKMMEDKDINAAKERREASFGNYRARVGLLGCGMIGSLVAEMLKAYDLEVLAFDPFLSDERAEALGVRKVGLDELFSSCNTVSNHLANNDETQKMLRYEHFSSMPEYGTFINTGRGAQVIEEDLVRALTERADLTAVLDVTYPEPAELTHPFYTLKNCFMTRHTAGSAGNEVVRMAEYMANEFELYASGKPCKYEVSLKMLETMA